MRLLLSIFTLCVLTLVPATAQTQADTAAAAALGRRDAFVITMFREPTICAPVLIVSQCVRDLEAYTGAVLDQEDSGIPNAGAYPFRTLRTAIAEGDLVHTSRALGYVNARSYPALPPGPATIATVTQAAALIRSAGPNRILQTLSAGSLMQPKNQAPIAALGLTPPNAAAMISPSGDAATAMFLQAVDAKFPPPPIVELPALDGRHDEIVLGIAFTTLRELFEIPTLARFPEMHPFLDETLRRIHNQTPALDADVTIVRDALGTTDLPRAQAAIGALNRLLTGIANSYGGATPADRRFAIGSTLAQLGYNAAVFRDPRFGNLVRIIPQLRGNMPTNDPLLPAFDAIAACAADDFPCQRKASVAFVDQALHSAPR